jgi:glycosyltransferase involved in cell wall biosynthesis
VLVLVGPPGWGVDVERLVAPLGDRVRVVGPVSEDEKRSWYALADVFAFPSLLEGFGLPVLEAMAQGTPVVTSAATATAEVVGAAGVLVDPTDSGSLAEGIRHLLDDAVAAGRFAAAGRARAGTLTWDAVAEQTVTVYRAALAA